ncbi:Amidohydrolase family protein [Pelosinus propionicus DSM 13327]|uniref:Amidohydrolase family protein n=2 Tax=Pelosinus TaxID=365348 RepID=A0A1I4PQK5_9FIRM|nr:Amidohydrolase family protein [Pelosinus propionicus DSM 13327]
MISSCRAISEWKAKIYLGCPPASCRFGHSKETILWALFFLCKKDLSKGKSFFIIYKVAEWAKKEAGDSKLTNCMLADIVLKNGVIYTADEKDQIYQAIAIKDNRILFTGSDKEVQRFISNTTQVIDLEGKMVLPGLIDSHIHPPGLALSELYEVQLFNINTIEGLWKL